jgi:uroporphyrinogen decarboxylase
VECDIRAPSPITKRDKPLKEWEENESYFYQDEWGTVLRMPKGHGFYYDLYKPPMEGCLDDEDNRYDLPDIPDMAPGVAEQAKAYQEKGFPVIIPAQFGNGFLQTGPRIFGYQDWLMMLAMGDKRTDEFMDTLLEKKIQCWDMIVSALGDSIDVVIESDDLGIQTGPFIDPGMVRTKLKPYYKKLYDHIHKITKAKILMHSCGSVVQLIPDFIDVGVDILNPVQISATGMDPAFLKKEFGKDICFWGGGIDTQRVLPFGTKEQIHDHVKRNIEIFGRDGGFVFGTVHDAQPTVPVENMIAMWETFKEFRNY